MSAPEPDREQLILALVAAGDVDGATAATLRQFGPEVLGFLHALAGRPDDVDEAWSTFAAAVWRGLPGFEQRSSLRTWLYVVARRALIRVTRRQRRDEVPLSQASELARLAAEVRQTSLPHLAAVRDRFGELRSQLAPDDQLLLVLRVDRELPWRDIAAVLADDAAADLDRVAATARKRFERVKAQVRQLAHAAGLVAPR